MNYLLKKIKTKIDEMSLMGIIAILIFTYFFGELLLNYFFIATFIVAIIKILFKLFEKYY